tara:strand:+ start:18838 stop:20253 length:1416 start_codon:yes stop_codon:yes gene_type:complete
MNKNIIATAVVALLIGGGTGYWISFHKSTEPVNKQTAASERKVAFYRNPMNPAITSPVPAKDDMGMDYIPVYPEENSGGSAPAGTVKIDPTVVQNIGVRTAKVTRATLSRSIRTIGRVTYDEQRLARLHPKYDGWVEKLFVDKTGQTVKKGSTLLSIYSPQLVATQEEYLLALNSVATLKESPFADVREGATSLLRSSRERLQLLDVPEHQINQIKAQRKVMKATQIQSPFNGIVMNIGAREGERITPDTELYMIADLSRIWVLVDIYEDDMPWVREGDTAKMQVTGIPGRTFTGKVGFIYPYLEAKTRTIKVRLEFDNQNLVLKPDMFAEVDILSDKQIDAVVVPSESIVRTGTQEQVFVQRAPGQFSPRKVTVGVSVAGNTQIVSGLQAGEIVVTSSVFLLDSESKLKEATAKMMEVSNPNQSATTKGKDTGQIQPEAAPIKPHQPDTSSTKKTPGNQNMDDMDMGDKR